MKPVWALMILMFATNSSFATTDGRPPKPTAEVFDCSGIMLGMKPPDPNFRPNDGISRHMIGSGLRFFLLELKETELRRFLTELVQVDSMAIPEVNGSERAALIPISNKYDRNWLRTPTFAKMTPLSDREVAANGGKIPVSSLIHPSRSVYVIIDARVLNDRRWNIYNNLSLNGNGKPNLYEDTNERSGFAEMKETVEGMAEMQESGSMYRGRFVVEGSILRQHMLGFLVQPGEPELSRPLEEVAAHLVDDRLVVIKTNDMGMAIAYFQNPEIELQPAQKTVFEIQRPRAPKRSSFY